MGIESNGMVLAASPDGGKPTLVSFDGDVPPGSADSVIDSHCHLADEVFAADLDAVVDRARGAGVTGRCAFSQPATDESAAAGEVRQRWREIRFAPVSIRTTPRVSKPGGRGRTAVRAVPRSAARSAKSVSTITTIFRRRPQRAVFGAQVAGPQLDRPVILHTREAVDDTFAFCGARASDRVGASFIALQGTPQWRGARWTSASICSAGS